MMQHGEQRRLAAVFVADMVGYSRLMEADERGTIARQKLHRTELIDPKIAEHHGRIVKLMGDGMLVEFASVVDAVECAIEVQRAMTGRETDVPKERRIRYRVGINLGDIVIEGEDIFGDGVNIAARLQEIAEPGGICISGTAQDHLKQTVEAGYEYLGERQVKNIEKPVRVYRVLLDPDSSGKVIGERRNVRVNWRKPETLAAAVVLVAVIAGVGAWQAGLFASAPIEDTPQTAPATAEDPLLALPKGPSIAVLPFDNLSGDAEQEYFSDGITEDIITRLSRFNDLRVIARNSTFGYKGKAVDIRVIGRELGADYVLEGSVRRSGQDLRVTAQLLDSVDGTHLWAETFDTSLSTESLFQVQDSITETVVSEIGGQHGVIARSRVAAVGTNQPKNIGSYECILLAYVFGRSPGPERHARARDCLEAVIETEPNYADALAALSMIYQKQYVLKLNTTSDYDPLERAFKLASRAVDLEPTNANAHRHLAMVYFHRKDIVSFRKHAIRAIKLNPNDPTTMGYLGIYLTWSGDMERGIPLVRKATTLNPELPLWFYQVFAFEHYMKDEYAEGLEIIEKNYGGAGYWDYIWKLFFLGHLGRQDEARAIYEQLTEVRPGFSVADYGREAAYWNVPFAVVEALSKGLRASGVPEGTPTN